MADIAPVLVFYERFICFFDDLVVKCWRVGFSGGWGGVFGSSHKLPIEDGVDIIVVNALAFKRYCDLAILINKNVVILTDNDGDIKSNITEKYKDYLQYENIKILYNTDENLKSVEDCVLDANVQTDDEFKTFRNAISKNGSHSKTSKADVLSFMKNNKTEWSMRVFDYPCNIKYPKYILDAVKK